MILISGEFSHISLRHFHSGQLPARSNLPHSIAPPLTFPDTSRESKTPARPSPFHCRGRHLARLQPLSHGSRPKAKPSQLCNSVRPMIAPLSRRARRPIHLSRVCPRHPPNSARMPLAWVASAQSSQVQCQQNGARQSSRLSEPCSMRHSPRLLLLRCRARSLQLPCSQPRRRRRETSSRCLRVAQQWPLQKRLTGPDCGGSRSGQAGTAHPTIA